MAMARSEAPENGLRRPKGAWRYTRPETHMVILHPKRERERERGRDGERGREREREGERGGVGGCLALHPPPGPQGNPTPNTLHPTLFNLNPTPYTLHPTPFTLHSTPHTLHTRTAF